MRTMRIDIGGKNRYTGQFQSNNPEQSIERLNSGRLTERVILSGGEPTLRRDLLKLLTSLKNNGSTAIELRTDGVLFGRNGISRKLSTLGVTAIYVPFPTARADAAEWLLGKGMMAKKIRGIKQAILEGLTVIAEIALLRPTVEYLAETIAAVHRLGIRRVLLRRMEIEDSSKAVALSPRFGLLEEPLKRAFEMIQTLQMSIEIEGVPDCILREWKSFRTNIQTRRKRNCRYCSGECSGVAEDYLMHFGWSELRALSGQQQMSAVTLSFSAEESTRSIRKRLMLAARKVPSDLRILGDFSHPKIYPVLREAQRLSIPKIWLVGDLRPLRTLSKLELIRLRSIAVLCHQMSAAPLPAEVLELYDRWSAPEKRFYIASEVSVKTKIVDRWFAEEKSLFPPYFRFGWRIPSKG